MPEAAFHFETRRKFFEEAFRVLKKDGTLVLWDLLTPSKERFDKEFMLPSSENYIPNAEAYEQLLTDVGFRNVVVKDVTQATCRSRFLYMLNRLHEAFHEGSIGIVELIDMVWFHYYHHSSAMFNVGLFARGQK